MMRARQVVSSLVTAAAVTLTSCGGGSPDSSAPPTEPVGTQPNSDSATSTVAPTTSDDPTEPVAPPTSEPVDLDEFADGVEGLLAIAPEPALPEVSAPATFEQLLAEMFADLVSAVAANPRAADAVAVDFFDRYAADEAPELVLATFASAAHTYTHLGKIVAAWLTAGAAADYGAEAAAYITPRIAFTETLNGQSGLTASTLEEAMTVDWFTQRCIAENLLGDFDSCDEPTAIDILADLVELVESNRDIDLPSDAEDDLARNIDICAIWTSIAATPAELERFDLIVDDSYFDTRILARSECRSQADLDEDPEWETETGSVALQPFYETVAAAALASGFDDDVYNSTEEEVYWAGKSAALLLLDAAILEGAQVALDQIDEPRLRLGLVGAALAAHADSVYQQLRNDLDRDEEALDEFFADCWDAGRLCEGDVFSLLWTHRRAGNGSGIAYTHTVIDWGDDVDDLYPLCDIWSASLAGYNADELDLIDFAMSQLDIEELIGLNGCPASGDDSDATSG